MDDLAKKLVIILIVFILFLCILCVAIGYVFGKKKGGMEQENRENLLLQAPADLEHLNGVLVGPYPLPYAGECKVFGGGDFGKGPDGEEVYALILTHRRGTDLLRVDKRTWEIVQKKLARSESRTLKDVLATELPQE